MKNTSRFILCSVLSFSILTSSFAQIFDKSRGKNLQKLISSPVTVYTYGDGQYSERLKAAFKDYWKITPYSFVNISGGIPKMEEGGAVFMPAIVGIIKDGNNRGINYPFYVFGEAGSSGSVSGEAIVAAFPINAYHNEFNPVSDDNMYEGSMLRLPYIVYNLHDMVMFLKKNGNEKGYEKYIEEKSTRLAGKTLIIPAAITKEWDINPTSTALFKNNMNAAKKPMRAMMSTLLDEDAISFSGKYKIMSDAEIMKIEQSPDADKYAIFLPALDQQKYLLVFDLKTKELLYYDMVIMSMKIKGKDFDKINKAAGL